MLEDTAVTKGRRPSHRLPLKVMLTHHCDPPTIGVRRAAARLVCMPSALCIESLRRRPASLSDGWPDFASIPPDSWGPREPKAADDLRASHGQVLSRLLASFRLQVLTVSARGNEAEGASIKKCG